MSERFKLQCVEGDDMYRSVLVDTTDGRELGIDGGEPEDNSFGRHWSWVPDELNALAEQLAALQRSLREAREAIARVECWTHEMGAALKPPRDDTYGEGMRDAKAQVARMLTPPPSGKNSDREAGDYEVRGKAFVARHYQGQSLGESIPVAGARAAHPQAPTCECGRPATDQCGDCGPTCQYHRGDCCTPVDAPATLADVRRLIAEERERVADMLSPIIDELRSHELRVTLGEIADSLRALGKAGG